MENKANKYGIILDGRMDEPVWDTVEEHTGFKGLNGAYVGKLVDWQTFFKILPCEDRIYIGVKCTEPEGMDNLEALRYTLNSTNSPSVEMFFSPSGSDYEFYQFAVTVNSDKFTGYYAEAGNIQPDRYSPDWDYKVYIGEEYWSMEVEIPLTAFYWTTHDRWSDKWLFNIARNRVVGVPGRCSTAFSSWCPLKFSYMEPQNFRLMGGFPIRPINDDLAIVAATAELTERTSEGYRGTMTVQTVNAVPGTFDFTSNHGELVTVDLQTGSNEFTAPCLFDAEGRPWVELCLIRKEDGKAFKRRYPVLAQYEPVKLRLTLPEYRNNFYPGQDYTKIVGTAISKKAVTLKLVGAGIPEQVITPNADGSFCFETPNFEVGEAYLTVSVDGYETTKKICRLAPTGHTMAWISGGNLVVNGKPTLRRDVYAPYYLIGEQFKRVYDQDVLHETHCNMGGILQPQNLMPGSEGAGGEATRDQMPSDEMLRKVDAVMESVKDADFVYYYLSDEPECRGLSSVYLRHLYEYVAQKDPYHLMLIASRSAGESVEFADWFETHPYICPYNNPDGTRIYMRPLHSIGKYVDDIAKLNRPDKCIGFLPTCFSHAGGNSGWDYPTLDEYICHVWTAMIHGAKTLWPYAGHDLHDRASLLEGTRYIFSTFEALEDIVLHGKRTILTQSTEAEAALYEYGEEKMFALVNYTQKPLTVTLDGISGTWHEFRHDRQITGNTFQLKPLETVVGTNIVKDAGLPTYQEVSALVDKLEYERTHSGSLFFNRAEDLELACSSVYGFHRYKLFDGTRDNQAFTVSGKNGGFMEVDQTKVKATIQKVCLYGYCLDNIELKFKIGEEWITPQLQDVQTEEFAKFFTLKEAICPDCLRFELNTDRTVEFYELEVY